MYRGYHIQYNPKPVGTRAWDWDFYHDDYDGAPDSGDHRVGSTNSEAKCRELIDEIEAELAD